MPRIYPVVVTTGRMVKAITGHIVMNIYRYIVCSYMYSARSNTFIIYQPLLPSHFRGHRRESGCKEVAKRKWERMRSWSEWKVLLSKLI